MRTFWTEKEIKFITENYSDMNTAYIATILNRPISGVYGKANFMGILKSKEYMSKMLEIEGKKLAEAGKQYHFKKGQVSHNKGQKIIKLNNKLKKKINEKQN